MRSANLSVVLASIVMLGLPQVAAARPQAPSAQADTQPNSAIAREVRHVLVMLPWFSVFDNLEYSVSGYTVTLHGQVVNPSLKSDAEKAVKKVEGVESVVNQIEVLPTSINDNQIRHAEFRAIYSQASLQRYAEGAVPPIHIIVKNGHVTLTGAVATQTDKDVAGIQANGVPGVFSVTNNLTLDSGK